MWVPGHPDGETRSAAASSIPLARGGRSFCPDRSYPSTGRRDPHRTRPIQSDGTCRLPMTIEMMAAMTRMISDRECLCRLTCGGDNSPFGMFANNSGQIGNGNTAGREEAIRMYPPLWWFSLLFCHGTRKENTGVESIWYKTMFPLVDCRRKRDPLK